jgi:hypothetical protein
VQAPITWLARAWLLYLLAGILWVTLGAAMLGVPRGLGLIFTGLACLALGLYGAVWPATHGYSLIRSR